MLKLKVDLPDPRRMDGMDLFNIHQGIHQLTLSPGGEFIEPVMAFLRFYDVALQAEIVRRLEKVTSSRVKRRTKRKKVRKIKHSPGRSVQKQKPKKS